MLVCLPSGSTDVAPSPSQYMTQLSRIPLVSCTFYTCWRSLCSPFLNSSFTCTIIIIIHVATTACRHLFTAYYFHEISINHNANRSFQFGVALGNRNVSRNKSELFMKQVTIAMYSQAYSKFIALPFQDCIQHKCTQLLFY